MSKLQTIMTRFAFRCPPIVPLRIASERSIRLLRAAHTILVEHGPAALAEFKRVHAEAVEWDRVVSNLRDAARGEKP